ncbi:hypothetical protein Tco_1342922 [Tanacetum coccineum]
MTVIGWCWSEVMTRLLGLRWWCSWWGGDERRMVMDGDDEAVVGRLGTWRNSKVVAWSSVSGGGDDSYR